MRAIVRVSLPVLALAFSVGLLGCGPTYRMRAPDSFKRFEDSGSFKWVTASGVMLKAREVENYPRADLAFWTDAMKRHLLERGYAFREEHCFETDGKLPGCTLEFLVPRGAEDWVIAETVFVVGKRIVLVEVGGAFARYEPVQSELRQALLTFDPGE